ncbi:hypothetical protein [Pantoea septica]|uniref:hypothetical protein n=1 Tax=Pantoea septica TaxID=472695 RepID=UPI000BB594AC|nr:hypothetical protein [Pantoea septica]
MTQQEVFDLAYKALSGITDDWNATYYEDLSGELKLQWIEEPIFQAQAYSEYAPGGRPLTPSASHIICYGSYI